MAKIADDLSVVNSKVFEDYLSLRAYILNLSTYLYRSSKEVNGVYLLTFA